jgi:glutamine amidotransferase
LAATSEEGRLPGLSWIQGHVKKFDESKIPHLPRLPHMGWNNVLAVAGAGLFSGLGIAPRFYFLHSFYFECTSNENILARADYGGDFSCAVQSKNIYGVQFHPEKSHHDGERLLKNFAEI